MDNVKLTQAFCFSEHSTCADLQLNTLQSLLHFCLVSTVYWDTCLIKYHLLYLYDPLKYAMGCPAGCHSCGGHFDEFWFMKYLYLLNLICGTDSKYSWMILQCCGSLSHKMFWYLWLRGIKQHYFFKSFHDLFRMVILLWDSHSDCTLPDDLTSMMLCMCGRRRSRRTSNSMTRARQTFFLTSGSSSVARANRFYRRRINPSYLLLLLIRNGHISKMEKLNFLSLNINFLRQMCGFVQKKKSDQI